MSIATVTSKGQITIPVDIRKELGIQAGDRINFMRDELGRVIFLPATKDITTLKAIVAKPDKAVSVEDMKATIKAKRGRT